MSKRSDKEDARRYRALRKMTYSVLMEIIDGTNFTGPDGKFSRDVAAPESFDESVDEAIEEQNQPAPESER
ncbi:hypothetical protein [Planctomicrobium piriforme]|uniref:Uncharacterized protein n=1 Tax=Planctomicrobium piriforme TaxID=1576369 RepID=A0A1I3EG69_9PLAN|nr:hypothetical protein [Planctomicrobium piriforme]SFH97918.1 hypothetical protein SAMN05421753_104207 [Planctomicrobium piriforme]